MPSNDAVLKIADVRKSFGETLVLDGVDLEFRQGTVHALIGPSGSGKTTLLRSLNGLEAPESGTLEAGALRVNFADGIAPSQLRQLRSLSAMVFQQHHLFPHLTVLSNVTIGPIRVQGRSRADAEAAARELLAQVGLSEKADAYPSALSGGQQQRVGIVRALAMRPSMLLFDEPTASLDPELVGDVLRVMSGLAREGWTMAVVTHELAFARAVADEVSFFDRGVVLEHGTPEQVFDSPQHERTARFIRRLTDPLA